MLHRNIPNGPDRALALTLTRLVLFVIANLFPLLSIRIQGQTVEMTLFAGVETLYQQGTWLLALVVFFTGIPAPGMRLALPLDACNLATMPAATHRGHGRWPCPRCGVGLHRRKSRIASNAPGPW